MLAVSSDEGAGEEDCRSTSEAYAVAEATLLGETQVRAEQVGM